MSEVFQLANAERENTDDGHTSALCLIAMAIDRLADKVSCLGLGDAATEMGAIEYLAAEIKEAASTIAASVEEVAGP